MSGDLVGTEDPKKSDWLREYYNQIESQVQFGDNKASLLVAGDAILLAITGDVIQWVSGCESGPFTRACSGFPLSFALIAACAAAALLVASLGFALWAAMPSSKHGGPPREFFLFSFVARLTPEEFAKWYGASSHEDLALEAMKTVHGKAEYARDKFLRLRQAVFATLVSVAALSVAVLAHSTTWIVMSLTAR